MNTLLLIGCVRPTLPPLPPVHAVYTTPIHATQRGERLERGKGAIHYRCVCWAGEEENQVQAKTLV
jgi:hypothetical protein